MKERLGEEFPAFLQSYQKPPVKGLRVNTLKIAPEEFSKISPFALEQVPWEQNGFYITEEKAGADVYHFAGLYYLQEPSAMAVGKPANACKKERVLDLCAAPGGKTTQVAAQMQGNGILIANEIDSARAKILSQNVERTGVKNCAVTNASPQQLAEQFPAYFDTILVDAPCSGEGMFKKEPNAIPEWSEENVKRCSERQKEILECAAQMLGEDGCLIYSTCTFAEEEDEWQIENFLKRHPEFELCAQDKYYPHERAGEGHFCTQLHKKEGAAKRAKPYPIKRNIAANRAFQEFAKDFFEEIPTGEITTLSDGRMFLVPAGMPDFGSLRLLRLGVELGEWDGKIFKPAHALAVAMGENAARKVVLTRQEAENYLRGETLNAECANGWCVVCVENFPLGLGKAVSGVVKNHYPKGLRMYKH